MCDTKAWGDSTVSVAKVVLPPLTPPAAFATRQAMKTEWKFLFAMMLNMFAFRYVLAQSARAVEYTDCTSAEE